MLLSYVAVAVLLAVGALAAWTWKLADPAAGPATGAATIEVVETVNPAPGPRIPVGKVRPLAGCSWTNMMITKEAGTKDLLTAFVGARYIIDTGLMEVTYDSGARVVLQGPTVYEVDGRNGGFFCTSAPPPFCAKSRKNTALRPLKWEQRPQLRPPAPATGSSSAFTLAARAMPAR